MLRTHQPLELSLMQGAALHKYLRERIGNITMIVHFGNGMAVFALGMTDMFYLRCFMVGASTCGTAAATPFSVLLPGGTLDLCRRRL